MNPALVKAVIWRETRFQPQMQGNHGERGLMQITEVAAADWVKAEKVETFVPTDLFDPKTNIEIGTWYLGRAMKHWAHKDDPIPFALSEYNAGRTRVKRWEKVPETFPNSPPRTLGEQWISLSPSNMSQVLSSAMVIISSEGNLAKSHPNPRPFLQKGKTHAD